MGYSIFQFNKRKLQELMFGESGINLNCGDLGLLNEIIDKYNSLPKYDIDGNGKTYVWINYEMLMKDFPILSMNIGTYRNVCRKLEKLGFIEKEDRAIKLQGGDCKKKTFFRPTKMTLELITTELDIQIELKIQAGLQPITEVQNVEKAPVKKKIYKKKDQVEKVEILEGQINVEEAIHAQETSDLEGVVKATGCTLEMAEEVLNYAINNNKINPVGFTIKAINEKWKLKNKVDVINPTKFNNFAPREYEYDKLEAMLLGHVDYSDDDMHEVLSANSKREHNYISNNSKRIGA